VAVEEQVKAGDASSLRETTPRNLLILMADEHHPKAALSRRSRVARGAAAFRPYHQDGQR
jgi:hypothetical protein